MLNLLYAKGIQLNLKDKNFTEDLINFLNEYGWDSYSKKDIKLYLFYLAQKYEYISSGKVNLEFAKQMKMTKRRLKNVLLESQLRFGEIPSGTIEILEGLFDNNETTYKDLKEGEFCFNIRNPILKEQVIDMLKENKMTPNYKNNKSILVLNIPSLINLIKMNTDIEEEKILQSVTEDIEKDEFKNFKDYINEFDKEELTISDAITGFLKEKSEEKIGKSFTKFISQKMSSILKNNQSIYEKENSNRLFK